jgi:AcrR family transcriptional regulator
MREWIPVPGTSKARLVLTALEQFGSRGYEAVSVTDLATGADVTTGSLYHHFGSKLGLYDIVREEAERRVLDRMEGAAAARAGEGPGEITRTALLVGFDYIAGKGMARLFAEQRPQPAADPHRIVPGTLHRPGSYPDRPPPRGRLARRPSRPGRRHSARPRPGGPVGHHHRRPARRRS